MAVAAPPHCAAQFAPRSWIRTIRIQCPRHHAVDCEDAKQIDAEPRRFVIAALKSVQAIAVLVGAHSSRNQRIPVALKPMHVVSLWSSRSVPCRLVKNKSEKNNQRPFRSVTVVATRAPLFSARLRRLRSSPLPGWQISMHRMPSGRANATSCSC